jgi:hypothetical protein
MKRPSKMSPWNRTTYVMTYAEALTKATPTAAGCMRGAREVATRAGSSEAGVVRAHHSCMVAQTHVNHV